MSDTPIYDETIRTVVEVVEYHENYGCPDCGEQYGCDCRWKGVL